MNFKLNELFQKRACVDGVVEALDMRVRLSEGGQDE